MKWYKMSCCSVVFTIYWNHFEPVLPQFKAAPMSSIKLTSSCQCLLDKTCFNLSNTISCIYLPYDKEDLPQCFEKYQQKSKKKTTIAFLGDSTMERLLQRNAFT